MPREAEVDFKIDDLALASLELDLTPLLTFLVRRLEEIARLCAHGHDPHQLRVDLHHELRQSEQLILAREPRRSLCQDLIRHPADEIRASLVYLIGPHVADARRQADVAQVFQIPSHRLRACAKLAQEALGLPQPSW